jgi:signal transduction histidine kinase
LVGIGNQFGGGGSSLMPMSRPGVQETGRPAATVIGWTTLLAAVATGAIASLPFIHPAYRAPGLHIALETANALIAGLVAFLLYGRFRQTGRLQELLVGLGLATIAVANLFLSALPSAVVMDSGQASSGWAALTVRLLGTFVLGAAALTPAARLVDGRQTRFVVAGLCVLLVVVAVVGVLWGETVLPALGTVVRSGRARGPVLEAQPAVLVAQSAGTLIYALAAVRFARQALGTRDPLFRWLAAGCVLGSFASAHYLFFPTLYSDYVYSGDVFRLGLYLCLLAGGAREIGTYWDLRTRMAVLAARRRVARDLHDGLAQELAFLWSQSQLLSQGARPEEAERIERITGAAGRALDEARRAIASLTRPLDEPFVRVLQQAADDLSSRYDVKIATDLDVAAAIGLDEGEALLRIVAEAVRNAVRHGAASRIDLVMTATPRCLAICDNGRGFFPGRTTSMRAGGFGTTSMRERAEGLGARLEITSAPGNGTTVRVTWP